MHCGDPSPTELCGLVRDAEIVVTGHTAIEAAAIGAAPRRGIAVHVVRNYGDRTIAEHALALLLAAARNIGRMDREVRGGVWRRARASNWAEKRLASSEWAV